MNLINRAINSVGNTLAKVEEAVFPRSPNPKRSRERRQVSRTDSRYSSSDGSPTRERSRNMNAQDSGRRRSARTPTPQDRHIVRDGSDIDRREREEDISSSDITSHGLELPTNKKAYERVDTAYKDGFYPTLTSSPPPERSADQTSHRPLEAKESKASEAASSLVHGDRSQLPLKTDTSWRPHEDVVQLREKIASLYVALQSAQSDQAAEMEKEKKNYQELLDDYRTVRSKLQDKRNRYTELEEKIAVQEAEHSRRIAEFEGTLRKFQRVHEHNINLITQQSSQVQTLQRDVQESRIRIEELEQEREQAIANRLQMDFFDNSVDRVSEAQLVGSMDSISSSVDELVSNFLDEVTELKSQNPEGATRDTTMLGKDAPVLLRAAVRTSPDSEKWGLLLDALLHEKVIGWLHRTLFSTTLGIPPSSSSTSLGQTLEDMYSVVSKNENWRAAQRWRSMTAKATRHLVPANAWKSHRQEILEDVVESLAMAIGLDPSMLLSSSKQLDEDLEGLFQAAQDFVSLATKDMLSARVVAVLGSDVPEARDIIWPGMGTGPDDYVVGNYSLGLAKVDESQRSTILLRPKVISSALLRFGK